MMTKGMVLTNPLDGMLGETLTGVVGLEVGSGAVMFETASGRHFRMWYERDCCASCSIEDVCGDVEDIIGSPLVTAEEVSNDTNLPPPAGDYRQESYTWTFYRIGTAKGLVTIRWYGESNGYYSERVSFDEVGR